MALNPQPYLSDSTDEFLIDALPAIAAGITPEEILQLAIADAEPDDGDNMERVLGFLQLWLVQPGLIEGWLVPTLRSLLATDLGEDERQPLLDQLEGALILNGSSPEGPLANDIGFYLAQTAFQDAGSQEFLDAYGSWFRDQRLEAIAELIRGFGGDPATPTPARVAPMT